VVGLLHLAVWDIIAGRWANPFEDLESPLSPWQQLIETVGEDGDHG
jgi:hypothetical protein